MTGGSRDTENHVISSLQGPPPPTFLGVNQLYTTCGSRNMENHAISTL